MLASAAAVALRYVLAPWLDPYAPYVTLYPLVIIAAVLWGKGPGLAAAVMGSLAVNILFVQPPLQFQFEPHVFISFALLVSCAIFLGHIGNRQRAFAQRMQIEADAARIAEAAWRASEERLRFALEISHTGAWELNLKDHSTHRSIEHDRIFGYPQLLPQWTYERFLEHVLPEDRAAVDAKFQEATARRSDWSFECRIRRKDGAVRWIWAAGRHRTTASTSMEGIIQDITERKQNEEALRRQATMLDSIMRTTDMMLVLLDPQFNFVWVNQSYAETCKTTIKDMIGKNHFALYPDEENEAIFRQVRDSGETVFYKDKPFVFPDQPKRGITYWDWSLAPVKNDSGAVTGLVLSLRETTQYKRAEERLRHSEERFRALLMASSEIIYRMNADWTKLHQLYGRGRLTGIRKTWLRQYIHPDDQPRVTAAIEEAIRTKSTFELAFRIRRADSSTGWMFSRAVPLMNAEGQISEWFGAASDITERKQAEEQLKENNRSKDEFLAMLAHELRNPLAPICNALHLLLPADSEHSLTDEQTRTLLMMIERQTNHLVRLVDELLDVSRITRGHIELKKERTDLAAVIGHALETSQPLIQAGGHALNVSLPPEPLQLEADPVRLAQVFANLLNNAAKYTKPGGHIQVTAKKHECNVLVCIRDTGEGIPPDMLPHVFDLFTQVNRSLDRAQGGLGIGLALVKRLVELHGGQVEVHSKGIGHGSEFRIRLPLPPQITTEQLSAPPAQTLRSPARILVVDDNRDAADSLAILLESMGAKTRVAYSGPEALEDLADFQPNVILLDLGMPGMDGFETAHRISLHPLGKNVTLVALTGWGQDEDRRRTREAGFAHHLVKPADAPRLRALLATLPEGK